jgi:heme-degrading monooxygenase HmoA
MYGTIAKIKVKPGFAEAIEEQMNPDNPDGFIATYALQADSDPNEFWLVAIFEDEDSYRANAERPETNAQYERLAAWFTAEPEWHDGQIVFNDQGEG